MKNGRDAVEMGLKVEARGTGYESGNGLDGCAYADGEDVCCGLEDFAEEESRLSGLVIGG